MRWLNILAELLVGHPDVGILVHASWRETYTADDVRDMLHPLESHFVGIASAGPRAQAIQQWLVAHPGVPLLAVDNEASEFGGAQGYSFIACDPQLGLSSESVQRSMRGWLQRTAPWPHPKARGSGLDLLYLDFDGAVHCADVFWSLKRGPYIDPSLEAQGHRLFQHCGLLERLLQPYPDVSIVLSTSWTQTYSFRAAAKRLPAGLRDRCIGATYHSKMERQSFVRKLRGQQVLEDVNRRRPRRWLAVDDVDEGWGEHRNNVVLTHWVEGIAHPTVLAELQAKLERFRTLGLGELAKLARETFETPQEASAWLNQPHSMLGGMTPEECAQSTSGAQRVADILAAIKHGGAL